jgi:gluconokinase
LSPRRRRITTIVVKGVAGVGTSSVMAALGERLAWPAIEGDSLHPKTNVAKMAAGVPLTDSDHRPWLDRIAAAGMFVSCSRGERSSGNSCQITIG